MKRFEKFCEKLEKTLQVIIDDEDSWLLEQYSWTFNICSDSRIYIQFCNSNKNGELKQKKLHRIVMKASIDEFIDHIDRNTLNNCKGNLRSATPSQNSGNRKSNNNQVNSKYKGVGWSKQRKRWYARLGGDGPDRWLGQFSTEIEAAIAYNKAAKEYFGDFALLNDVNLEK